MCRLCELTKPASVTSRLHNYMVQHEGERVYEIVKIWHERATKQYSTNQFAIPSKAKIITQEIHISPRWHVNIWATLWNQYRQKHKLNSSPQTPRGTNFLNPPPKKLHLQKVARQLVSKQKKEEKKKEGEEKQKSVGGEKERERKRREEDCWAGAILDVICLLGDGAPALKSPLGARIVWEEPAIFCSIIYHCHHIMIPLAAPYWCL